MKTACLCDGGGEHGRRLLWLNGVAGVLALIASLGPVSECPAWGGKVIDRQTRKPVEGAVAIRRWEEYTITPITGGQEQKGAAEGLSDRSGRFSVSWWPHLPINPFVPLTFSWTREIPPVVYKAGYELYVGKEVSRPGTIELERVASTRGDRKRVVEDARYQSGLMFWHEPKDKARLARLSSVIAEEEEFLGLPSPAEARPFPIPYWAHPPAKNPPPPPVAVTAGSGGNPGRSGVGLAVFTQEVERPLPAMRPEDTVESQRAILADPGRPLEVRADAAFRLGALSRDPGDAERLADLLYAFPPVDVGARQGLERMGDVAVEPLIRVLRDAPTGKKGARSERPRHLAAKAAETVRDPRLKVETMRLLGEVPKEGFVAESLARGLGNYGDAEAAEALVRIVLAEHRGRRREESFRSLIRIGPPAIGPLSATLGRSTAELQVEVIYCLMKIGDRESTPALIASLKDSDPNVRWAARCALALIGEPPGAIPQIESWRSRDAAIRREATLGILAMGPAAKKPLIDALQDPDPGIRWRAAWCLGWIGDPALAEPLGLLKNDRDRNVRWLGAEAIARIGKRESAEHLRGYCSETDPGIRRIADEALTASGREGCSKPR